MNITVEGNNIDKALKAFKRKLQKEGYFREIKKRSFYEKPSQKRKRKQQEAKRRRMKSRHTRFEAF